jgi:hypothetical protein
MIRVYMVRKRKLEVCMVLVHPEPRLTRTLDLAYKYWSLCKVLADVDLAQM